MKNVIKGQLTILVSLLAALTITLMACGGGSSSTGGGSVSSGSTLSGTVNDGVAAIESPTGAQQLLTIISNLAIRSAHAGMGGVQVDLYKDGALVDTQFTDSGGNFMFTGLMSGIYSVMLSKDGALLGQSPPIQVDPNTKIKAEFSANGDLVNVEIEAEGNQLAGDVDGNSSNDLTSSDDQSSDSSDLTSSDDQSSDSSDDQGSDLNTSV